MNVRHSMAALHSFSIKNIFYDNMDLRLFNFHVTICIYYICVKRKVLDVKKFSLIHISKVWSQ